MVVVAQLVRASVCGTEGRGFEPHLPPLNSLKPFVYKGFGEFYKISAANSPQTMFNSLQLMITIDSKKKCLYTKIPLKLHYL